jgi:ABC-type cobalamin/Fe3+-siderophores transport system ATPase subunit
MRIDRLSLEIEGKRLLNSISFQIPLPSIYLLLGPNGAGKTLLLRCLAGLHRPTSGQILPRASELAWVPLSQALPFHFTVEEVVMMGRFRQHQGFPQARDRRVASDAAERVGVISLYKRAYNSLSRGEQTKVDIARALASESPMVLLDEPFSNLDIDASLQMTALFQELLRSGKTLVLSHHDLYSARDLATHGLLIRGGEVLVQGAIAEIFQPLWIQKAYNVSPIFGSEGLLRFESLGP